MKMNNEEYAQYCRLQAQIRTLGFSPVYDQNLEMGLRTKKHYFMVQGDAIYQDLRMRYNIHFFKIDGSDDFTLNHYTGIYRKDIDIPARKINGVNLVEVERKMKLIDWNEMVPNKDAESAMNLLGWKVGEIVEKINASLDKLSTTETGVEVMTLLMAKYMSNTRYLDGTGLQESFDKIDDIYRVSSNFFVRGNDPPTTTEAVQSLAFSQSLPPSKSQANELYTVHVKGAHLMGEGSIVEPMMYQRFFSSVKKAFDFIERIDNRCFGPTDAVKGGLDKVVEYAVIGDTITGSTVATKLNSKLLENSTTSQVGWHVNEQCLPKQVFEQMTGGNVILTMDQLMHQDEPSGARPHNRGKAPRQPHYGQKGKKRRGV